VDLNELPVGRAKTEPEDQPMLVVSEVEPYVHDLVADDVRRRGELGKRRYGTKLQPFNGRRSLQDSYEELVDAACYTLQAKIEVDALLAAWCELDEDDTEAVREAAPDLAHMLDKLMRLA
jgi:hypothetical protein